MATDEDPLIHLRAICFGLPEVTERISHGAPCFFIREKRTLVYFHDDHHGDGRVSITCPAPPGVQEQMVEAEPERFFRPPYVGHRGWLGMRLDIAPDWDEVAGLIAEAYRLVAPKTLVNQLDQ